MTSSSSVGAQIKQPPSSWIWYVAENFRAQPFSRYLAEQVGRVLKWKPPPPAALALALLALVSALAQLLPLLLRTRYPGAAAGRRLRLRLRLRGGTGPRQQRLD
jgi:hypothetical protein